MGATIFAGLVASAGAALAQEAGLGAPFDWQMGFQESANPVMREIVEFHNFMLWLITAIVIFVLGLMLYNHVPVQREVEPCAGEEHPQHLLRRRPFPPHRIYGCHVRDLRRVFLLDWQNERP